MAYIYVRYDMSQTMLYVFTPRREPIFIQASLSLCPLAGVAAGPCRLAPLRAGLPDSAHILNPRGNLRRER